MNFVVVFTFILFVSFKIQTVNSQQAQCGGIGKKLPKSCKTNENGFLCCNDGVGSLINEAVDDLKADREAKGQTFNENNLQAIATAVGKMAENRFNSTFETVVGLSNFASKTRFNGDLLCKVKTGKSFVLSYATAKKNRGDGWIVAAAALAKDVPFGPDEYDGNFHTFTYRV